MQVAETGTRSPEILVWALLYQTFTAILKETERALAGAGISGPQAFALDCLKYGASPMIPARLAAYLAQESQSLTGLLDRMESQGWVRRVRDLPDRRSLRLELTPQGEAKLAVAQDLGWPAMYQAFAVLTPSEVLQLGDLLERLRHASFERIGLDPAEARAWPDQLEPAAGVVAS